MVLISTINRYTLGRMKPLLFPIMILIIVSFGLVSSITLISSNVTASYFQIIAFLANYLPNNNQTPNENTVTFIKQPMASWFLLDSDLYF